MTLYKEDIQPLEEVVDSSKIYDLKPVAYRYKADIEEHMGFIAEDVEEVIPRLISRDVHGRPDGIYYIDIIPLLVGEIKRLNNRIEALERG